MCPHYGIIKYFNNIPVQCSQNLMRYLQTEAYLFSFFSLPEFLDDCCYPAGSGLLRQRSDAGRRDGADEGNVSHILHTTQCRVNAEVEGQLTHDK